MTGKQYFPQCLWYFHVPSAILNVKDFIPAVLAFSIFGAYSARNSLFDVLVAVVFGLIGLVFKRFQIPVAPAVLGMILGLSLIHI